MTGLYACRVDAETEQIYDSFADRHALLVVLIPVGVALVIAVLTMVLMWYQVVTTPMNID
jgi:hypothetical protein